MTCPIGSSMRANARRPSCAFVDPFRVIPEGAGPCQPAMLRGLVRLVLVSRIGADKRHRGVGVKAWPQVNPRSGCCLDIGSEWRRISAAGDELWSCEAAYLQGPMWTGGSADRIRLPVIPSPRGWWHGVIRPQPGGANQIARPRRVGVRHGTTTRPGCVRTRLTPVGPGNGYARRGARRTPG